MRRLGRSGPRDRLGEQEMFCVTWWRILVTAIQDIFSHLQHISFRAGSGLMRVNGNGQKRVWWCSCRITLHVLPFSILTALIKRTNYCPVRRYAVIDMLYMHYAYIAFAGYFCGYLRDCVPRWSDADVGGFRVDSTLAQQMCPNRLNPRKIKAN